MRIISFWYNTFNIQCYVTKGCLIYTTTRESTRVFLLVSFNDVIKKSKLTGIFKNICQKVKCPILNVLPKFLGWTGRFILVVPSLSTKFITNQIKYISEYRD